MKGSLIILSFFILGITLGYFTESFSWLVEKNTALYVLYILIFLVGISIGQDDKVLSALKGQNFRLFILPLGTIVGTLTGTFLISFLISGRSISDCMAVGSGFGYYSLSSVIIDSYKGAELGTVALLANIFRELIALLGAPLLVKYFGKLSVISVGGATTMDTTLPIITQYSGKEFVIIAIFHGFLVDLSVPFLVTFFCII